MARLVGLGQLARALRLPREWLKSEAEAQRIPFLRVGSRLRFNVIAVEAALVDRASIIPQTVTPSGVGGGACATH
jgi:hypothetical protein